MIDTDRLRPKLSPLDWYKLGSSVLFAVLGGFVLIRALIRHPAQGMVTQLLLGGLIFLYGGYRLWAAYRNLRRLLAAPKREPGDEPDQELR
jgi:hypothetical protein